MSGNKGFPNVEKFKKQLALEVEKGTLKPMNAEQLFLNILALNLFPFVATPLIKAILNLDDKAFKQLIEDRKTEVADFIINSIKA